MKKVMLVDDEILVRETIRDCIQWEQEGFEYCGDAPDGEIALPMIEQLQPDILITDIKMPFMNGLELSAIVRNRMPSVKIILLSGHGEFEYARAALRMGVEEYCLKPISAAGLTSLLHSVSDKINGERRERERLARLKESELEQAGLTREKLLNDLCSGFIGASEAINRSAGLSLNLVAHYYAVALLDIRSEDDPSAAGLYEDNHQPQTWYPDNHTAGGSDHETLMFRRSRTETVWIMKGDSLEELQQRLLSFQNIEKTAEDKSPSISISVGIGSVRERLHGIHISFMEAEEDMHTRRLSRRNRRNVWDTVAGSLQQTVYLDRSRFIEFLRLGSTAQTAEFVAEFAHELRSVDWHSSLAGYYILNDLTLEIFRTAKELCGKQAPPGETLNELQKSIESVRTWEDACDYLIALAEQFRVWRSRCLDKYSDMLLKVKEYMHSNYDKDYFSLQDTADYVKISPSHLSKVFSQETGQTFIDYLTQIRIRKAMELLQSTNAKSYEIAFQVGYNDAHYFSNLFKRITGVTTTEFRKTGRFSGSPSGREGADHAQGELRN
ncbi:response regulator [Paenibacillus sp. sptzw28]|uniref:response regulator n=1 Tax=Paenibacillus sp. sptzw28 TaxID=715179 RepID=UPI001C6E2B81|nr:response regulator [Paenibacillus sp. sptzw28]QYR22390.1 response regulator [Paenibacillus sp. sptzw28]